MKEDAASDIDRSNKSESEENEDKKNKDTQPQEQKKQKKNSPPVFGYIKKQIIIIDRCVQQLFHKVFI